MQQNSTNISNFTTDLNIESLLSYMTDNSKVAMGYPTARGYDYSALYPFLTMPINNCGDPFGESTYKVQTHNVEREVVSFVANLFRAPKDAHWGYVTNGGTEGNLYGLYLARETLPTAKAYYSKAAHYSIKKNLNILRIETVEIDTDDTDAMNLEDLKRKLDPNTPAIIMATCGTTMKQGRDDVAAIKSILTANKMDHYIHCDAALDGMIAPFLKDRPKFDFVDGADSIAVSGHKFIGCPIPCGVVVCKRELVDAISNYIPYIHGRDETITGSRNGITPLFLWYAIRETSKEGFEQRVLDCVEKAEYTQEKMLKIGIDAKLNKDTITVTFPKPSKAMIQKWQLATQSDYAHVLTVPGISYELIDKFIEEIAEDSRC